MKYSHEIVIDLPIDRVIELFDNPDNMSRWQEGLVSFETIEGTAGEVGAKSKLVYDMGKRRIEMIETITVRDLPHQFSGTYEAKNVWNLVENFFESKDDGQTKWTSRNEFKCTGMMKLMVFLMPGAFKKQSYKYMLDFKKFAESMDLNAVTDNED